MIAGLVLAAGAGKRFGGVKQLAELGGQPLLEHVLAQVAQARLDSVAEAAVVLLGDQPLVGAPAIRRVLSARGGGAEAIRATYGGEPGHPVVLERRLFPRLLELRGDVGARDVLAGGFVREIACDGIAEPADVDTQADLRALEESVAN